MPFDRMGLVWTAAGPNTTADGRRATSAMNGLVVGDVGSHASQKWQFECQGVGANGDVMMVGLVRAGSALDHWPGWNVDTYGYYAGNGRYYNNGASMPDPYSGTFYTDGGIVGVAYDPIAGTIEFRKNGVQSGPSIYGVSGQLFPAFANASNIGFDVTNQLRTKPFYPLADARPWAHYAAADDDLETTAIVAPAVLVSSDGAQPSFDEVGTLLAGPLILLTAQTPTGFGVISGTIKRQVSAGVVQALARRVRLYRDSDGVFVAQVMSDAVTGSYQFTGLDRAEAYTAIAHDSLHSYRATAADNLTPI